jgi:hypothetical protein
MEITLDLHPVFRIGRDTDMALREIISKAARTWATAAETLHGSGPGQLRKGIICLLGHKHIRKLSDDVEPAPVNTVHFTPGPSCISALPAQQGAASVERSASTGPATR